MTTITEYDAHEQPTEEMRAKWKAWARMEAKDVKDHPRIDDPRKPTEESGFIRTSSITKEQRREAFSQFGAEYADEAKEDVTVLHHPLLPGLLIAPSLVPPAVQTAALDRMLHRDLSDPQHQTNLHLHYNLPYPEVGDGQGDAPRSLFSLAPESPVRFTPKDPSVHKPLSPKQDYLLLRLRSGDAIYMTQESRFAWHGVPKIVPGTCPEYIENWPARDDGQFGAWGGWMKNKRINLNVRQVRD
ncbi:hypothetical protein LLEC1_05986 [Akanthomyces lecanii]|uniref:Alpha-ketoglutarate-dependent dioxygenase AlkB-like domain-containing protein n=1 Tax=Cordyceps confragosa TaxID=2714763 RepID=A0A179I2P8_CORDF|nr:hypothetical protein LLEC1_05986 [Akanthomyces lecanii]